MQKMAKSLLMRMKILMMMTKSESKENGMTGAMIIQKEVVTHLLTLDNYYCNNKFCPFKNKLQKKPSCVF